ncbi:carbohydrate-binding protein [Caballeronia cordobensis]|uniref:Carbohydrate-binding protein n=1 Tax=Caballeronia cordobensis TaxID=1353886 RepID=A0A158I6Y3_CABCO|nr:neuraminidase-like domain-containing protein [Caballeronia cordobensis]SAL52336.1 carbohydrate-binding protein [Caballeronia cordobensis]
MTIATIRQLQDALRRIGALDAGYVDGEVDEPTRAALARFQREAGLPREGEASGQPDAQTLSTLDERAERSGRFILRGWVIGVEGPLPEVRVRAEDRDVNDLREPLGDRDGQLTDRSGRFEILYTAEQFARGDKDTADVMLTLQRSDERITNFRVYRLQPGTWPPRDKRPRRLLPLSAKDPLPSARDVLQNTPLTAEALQLGIPARPVEELKIIVGNASDGTPSEYERLRDAITPLLRDRSPTALDEDKFRDLTFVAREIDLPRERIEEYVSAWKLAEHADIRPEVLYGLLRNGPPASLPGLSHDLPSLLEAGEAAWRRKLEESLALNFIPSRLLRDFDGTIEQLRRARVSQADRPMGPGRESLSDFLVGVAPLESGDARRKFLDLYHAHDGSVDEFWQKAVPEAFGWKPSEVLQVQTALQLAEITSFNLPLVERIRREHAPSQLEDLTAIDSDGWLRMVRAAGVPEDSPGDDPADQQKHAADGILRTLQSAYPNRYVAQIASQTGDAPLREASDLLRRFFDREQGSFDLCTTPVTHYLRENGKRIYEGLSLQQQDQLSSQLKRLQRTFQLSTGLPQMQSLLELDLDSAYKVVTRTSQAMFRELYAEKLGGTDTADAIYARALKVHSTVTAVLGDLMQFSQGTLPKVMHASIEIEQKVKDNPVYTDLFGSLDLCACEHCRSMYSPAAYLVDLLAFLDTPKGSVKANPLDVLIGNNVKRLTGRRPDLAHIQLTCDNTNTRIPYIDLVDEILESYIAHNQPFAFNRPPDPPNDELPHPTAEELGANPVYLTQDSDQSSAKASDALRKTVYPLTLPFNTELVTARIYLEHLGTNREEILRTFALDEELDTLMATSTETLRLSPQDFEIVTVSQFSGQSSTIAATLGVAYGFSEANDLGADFPPHAAAPRLRLNDPRKLAVKALQHYLNLAGAAPPLTVNGTFDAKTQAALGAFQVAAGGAATGEADGGVWFKFDTTSDTPLSPLMSYVPIFLERTGFTYAELVELVKTRFLNGAAFDVDLLKRIGFSLDELSAWIKAGFPALSAAQTAKLAVESMTEDRFKRWAESHRDVVVIGVPAGADCNLDATTLRHLDGSLLKRAELLRLNAFIRLWRRLQWPLQVLDRAYAVLYDDVFDFIVRLADAVRVQRELEIEPEASLCFWGNIDTRGDPSVYDRLFRNKAALRIEPIFVLDETRSELKAVTDNPLTPPKIADHVPSILSAFRIRGSDLDLLLSTLNVGKTLNLSSLSLLNRYVLLAKSLSIPIPALLTLKTLSGTDPFAPGPNLPRNTFDFIELVRKVQAGNYNPALLDFIFRHHVAPPSQPEQPTAATVQFLDALRMGLAKIEAEHRVQPDPAGELSRSELSIVESDPRVVDEAIRMIDGSVRYALKLAGLPAAFAFPVDVRQKTTYDAGAGTLTFQGVMTPAEKALLAGAAVPLPAAVQPAYVKAIGDLFDLPRTFFNDHLATFFAAPATATAKLLDRPSLDSSLRQVMLDSTGTVVPRDPSGNLPAAPVVVDTEIGSKFAFLLDALVPRTRERLKTAMVMQSASDAFGIETRVAAALLRNPTVMQSIRDPGEPAIADFLELTGDGLSAAYFTNATLDGDAVFVRTDTAVDFDWTAATPDPAKIPAGDYSVRWSGLIVAERSEEYTFSIECADGARLWVGGHLLIDDWSDQPSTTRTGKLKLEADALNSLRLEYYKKTVPSKVQLTWSSASVAASVTPVDALFSGQAATRSTKAALIASMLRLDAKEIVHFATAKLIEFGKLPLNGATAYDPVQFWKWVRLVNYAALRNVVPDGETDLIDVFEAPTPEESRRRLAEATGWRASEIDALTGQSGFGFKPADFNDEQRLRRLPDCFKLMQRLGITANRAREWARIRLEDTSVAPSVIYWAFTIKDAPRAIQLAQDMRNIARAKHDDKSWIEVAKPLSDALRDQRKAALLGYVLAMPSIIERNVTDSGRLFEFFLVDVDTTSCTETSRIKQAISSVQLFIHRCLMGLEDQGPLVPYTVVPAQIDEPRWRWMQREVLWEANQKVFRYPENWLKPELRDDRTPFFRELESDLLQSDLTDPYAEKALLGYLEKLDDVARLEICGVREEPSAYALHVFGRTRNTPHVYFHRTLTRKRGDTWDLGTWSAWQKVPLDIEGVDDGDNGELSGVHLLPIIWNRRLYAFWPTFRKKPDTAGNANLPQGFGPIEQWDIRLSWSEFFQGKWLPRQHSDAALVGIPDDEWSASITQYHDHFAPAEGTITYTTTDYFMGIETGSQSYTLPTIIPKTISGGELDGVHLETAGDYAEVDISESSFEMNQLLPPPAGHLFSISPGSDQLHVDAYQRYTGTATGKKSNKRVVDTVVVQGGKRDARQKRDEQIEGTSRSVTCYRWIGRFSVDGCRNKVTTSPGNLAYSYYALLRPKGTSNFFNWMLADPSQKHFELDSAPVILGRLPSAYRVLDSDPDQDFRAYSPFFYQDSQRVYLVVMSAAPPPYDFNPGMLTPFNTDLPELRPQQKPFNPKLDLGRPFALVASQAQMKINPWVVTSAVALDRVAMEMSTTTAHVDVPRTMTTMSGTLPGGSVIAAPLVPGVTIIPAYYGFIEFRYQFLTHWHPHVCEFISRLNRDGIATLLGTDTQRLTNDSVPLMTGLTRFRTEYAPSSSVARPYPLEDVDFQNGAYSLYNWELFFHAPLLIAQRLSKNQRFAEAQRWYHFIFNPLDNSVEAPPAKFWKFLPFKTTEPERLIEMLELLDYQGTDAAKLKRKHELENQVDEWAHDPFNPHRIARLRHGAYMKNVVMGYVDNLISWGDYLFSQDTLESINEATHLYVIASSLLGPRPQKIPAKTEETRKTFAQLRPSLDALSNAHVAAETLFPFATSDVPLTPPGGAPSGLTTTTLFFCLPPNDQLLGYWDRIEDRLFKIRHCMNIEGVVRQLPLFDPPIDPALLVEAAAKGIDLNSVLNDLYTPLPRYRFEHMLQKALDMCSEVRSFGAALLAVTEKRDAETLAQLRTTHERAMLDMVRKVKAAQVSEAQANRDALTKSRAVAAQRFMHYQGLLGYKADADFAPGSAAPIVSDRAGDNRLPEEVHQQERMRSANEWQEQAATWDFMANAMHYAIPDFSIGTPNCSTTYGGSNIGAALTAMGHSVGNNAATATYEGNNAAVEASFRRRDQTWVLESNIAARDIEQIDKQIAAADIRIAIAERDLDAHDKQIEQNEEMREFLTERKFTQEELYFWMQNELATLHLQCYQIAYQWAKQTQGCYRFATGTDNTFIQFGSWDSLRKGLLSGERLHLQLKQMERSYMELNRREYEVTRHVSLATVDPAALIRLRQTGQCEVSLPETLFDLDFPGHYMRRLKSVALTIPCVVGPYTGVNCTLTLLRSEIRKSPLLSSGYRRTDDQDSRFTLDVLPTQSIATSQAQSDTGTFELNFRDERFLPFEGGGAISTWRIELQNEFRQFDYDTIADVVLHLKYTSREGGALLSHAAIKSLKDAIKDLDGEPVMRLFSLRQEYATDWYRFLDDPAVGPGDQSLTMSLANDRFPFAFQARKISIETISVFVKVRPELAATHNEGTLKITLEPGKTATPGAAPIALASWNGLLRGDIPAGSSPGDWTMAAWLSPGGAARARLSPGSLEDVVLVCACTCT